MEGIHWVLLTLAMAVVSLGMSGIVKALGALTAFLIGSICLIYGLSSSSQLTQKANIWRVRRVEDKESKMPCKSRMPDTSAPNSAGLITRLTGISIVDNQLNQIIGYIFRDYVYGWHFDLTHSSTFPSEAEDSLHLIVANLAFKIREVDLINFLTTRLVDDVASHVRLYKQARGKLKNIEEQSSSGENYKQVDLESLFFDAEVSMEGTVTCRDQVSSSQPDELLYLQDVAETLLFMLLPECDFNAIPLRTLLRELLVNMVFKPLLELISDPDTINQSLIWAVTGDSATDDYCIKHDVFTSSLRYSDCLEELQATREMVSDEISCLRSNDSKGGSGQKQQLNSLLYLRKVIDARIHVLQSGKIDSDSISGLIAGSHGSSVDWNQMIGPGLKLFSLPIEVILKNNIAIGYFIDYMSFLGCASYVYFYLNIEGWKVSMEQQIQAIQLETLQQQHHSERNESKPQQKQNSSSNHHKSLMENMREAAHSIFEEYLSEKANPRLKLDDSILKRLLFKIRTEPPNSEWFDEVQVAVYSKLETDERFLESFKRSIGYVKLLQELDLLKDPSTKSETGDDDRMSTGDCNSLSGETLDDNSSGAQPSCQSIYGDQISLNSYDSANYSYDSTCAHSINEVGNGVNSMIISSSSEKLNALDENREQQQSLPIFPTSKTIVTNIEPCSQDTTTIQTTVHRHKIQHRRTGSSLSDSLKPADSDYESEKRNSPRPQERHSKHYQTALFMGGGHWSVSSSARGDDKNETVTNLDHTLVSEPLDYGDKVKETLEETTSIEAEVMRVEVVKESVTSYAIYTIRVQYRENWGNFKEEGRDVFRRYSDFYSLHEKISNQYPNLPSRLPEFPSKKTFGNMEKQLLEKRRHMFNVYLKALLKPSTIKENFGIIILLERFLDHSSTYEKDTHLRKAVGSVKSSVKSVKTAVTAMPNNLVNTVGNNIDGLKGVLHMRHGSNSTSQQEKDFMNTERVGANIDVETSDNIPLRILLLFMDEVFDLREKNQWLRRQIVAVLRQSIKALFGDIVNRRIVDYFAQMTSPETLCSYLESFKQSFWPNGYPAADREPRDENTKMRTRVAARAALFSSFSDDLRRLIGSETTRSGLLMLFEMLQHPVLNKRIGIAILEGILELLFQDQDFKTIFHKLHSRSTRVRNELRNSQRKYADIRR